MAFLFLAMSLGCFIWALGELLVTAKRYAKGHETVYGRVMGMASLAIKLVIFKFLD